MIQPSTEGEAQFLALRESVENVLADYPDFELRDILGTESRWQVVIGYKKRPEGTLGSRERNLAASLTDIDGVVKVLMDIGV